MTDDKLLELESKALRATPGPWECSDLGPSYVERPKKKPVVVPEYDDAAFIAAASPAVVLELIKEIYRYRQLMKQTIPGTQDTYEALVNEVRGLRQWKQDMLDLLDDERFEHRTRGD